MKDVEYDPDEESRYECFHCGTIVTATNPATCPECEREMRNRQIPLE